jgi:hypothetical protein
LTSAQLSTLDDIVLERDEALRKAMRQQALSGAGGNGGRSMEITVATPMPSGMKIVTGGPIEALRQGKPYNPFKQDPNTKVQLAKLITQLLQKN